jgi:hypothetical protein
MSKPKTVEAIELAAKQRLSSLNGDSFEGSGEYTGAGDDMLYFSGSGSSFLSEEGSSLTYSFKLQNTGADDKVIALVPTYLGTADEIANATGETVDGVLTDGTIITDVVATAGKSKLTIAGLQKFTERNASRILDITISSNTEATFERDIVYQHLSPFRSLGNNSVPLTEYVDPDQQNSKKAIIPVGRDYPDFQLNDQTVILIPIGGTSTAGASGGEKITVTIRFGAILNMANSLQAKTEKANRTKAMLAGINPGVAKKMIRG